MKNILMLALAFCAGAVLADDPTITYTGAGCREFIVDAGGDAISNSLVKIDLAGGVVPWKVSVSGATKTATSSVSEFVPTQYVGVCSSTVTNWYSTVVTDTSNGSRIVLTNSVTTAVSTNSFNSIANLNLADWAIVATNGYTKSVSVGSPTAAGGTLVIADDWGHTFGTLTLSGGAATLTDVFNASKIAYSGTLRLTATEAERLKFHIEYLKLK